MGNVLMMAESILQYEEEYQTLLLMPNELINDGTCHGQQLTE